MISSRVREAFRRSMDGWMDMYGFVIYLRYRGQLNLQQNCKGWLDGIELCMSRLWSFVKPYLSQTPNSQPLSNINALFISSSVHLLVPPLLQMPIDRVHRASNCTILPPQSASPSPHKPFKKHNSPFRPLFIQNPPGAMRACNKRILAKAHLAAAVAAEVGHDGASVVGVARGAALGGGLGGRYLVFFARHVGGFAMIILGFLVRLRVTL